jgi:3-dehydrosphinganine reductase
MELNLYNGRTSLSHPPTKIHLVCPGTILSPGYETENATKPPVTKLLEKDDPKQSADEVASASLNALARGEYLITTQWLGHAMRVSSLGGSPRHGWGVVDVLFGLATAVAWLFIGPDMEAKVWRWGKENRV